MDSKEDDEHRSSSFLRAFFLCATAIAVAVLLAVFIVWLVLRPAKPRFYLEDATIRRFNITADSNILDTVIQVTVSSRNPNGRIGIYYDRLEIYATYRWQQISLASALPPGYQGHGDIDVWSPYLYGQYVPVAPYVSTSLAQDEASGFLLLYVKIDGRIRWKVGSWISGHYSIYVGCPALLTFSGGRGNNDGGYSAPSIKFQHISTCSVDV